MEIYRKLLEILKTGEPAALATVVRTRGSVPRREGTRMVIHPLGRHEGTVGGGCGEARVIREGLRTLDSGKAELVAVDLTEEVSLDSTGICGGKLWVLTERFAPSEAALVERFLSGSGGFLKLLDTALGADFKRIPLAVGAKLPKEVPSEMRKKVADALASGRARLFPGDEGIAYLDIPKPRPMLLICGAGHIAVPLASMGDLLGFRVVVLDDRKRYANRERFPMADEVISEPFSEALEGLPIDASAAVVLVTRGHSHDVECLLQVIDKETGYLGMIGSRRRVQGVFHLLGEERGIDPARLARVHAPIGLDIGARTPAEIALAIASEIVLVLRGGTGAPMKKPLPPPSLPGDGGSPKSDFPQKSNRTDR